MNVAIQIYVCASVEKGNWIHNLRNRPPRLGRILRPNRAATLCLYSYNWECKGNWSDWKMMKRVYANVNLWPPIGVKTYNQGWMYTILRNLPTGAQYTRFASLTQTWPFVGSQKWWRTTTFEGEFISSCHNQHLSSNLWSIDLLFPYFLFLKIVQYESVATLSVSSYGRIFITRTIFNF